MHENLQFTVEKGIIKPCDIAVYALSTCGFCRSGLEFLRSNKIAFKFIYVDQLSSETRTKVKKDLAPLAEKFDESLGFPFVVINNGKKIMIGFTESKWRDEFLKK